MIDPGLLEYLKFVIAIKYRNSIYSYKDVMEFLRGNWVDSEKVQGFLKMSFDDCYRTFDFSRTAEWWSIVGKTEEERSWQGQKIVCRFRLKDGKCIYFD